MRYDVVIVGAGIAGMTSAAFLSKKGYKVLVVEKEEQLGGLVSSFSVDGFLYDAGARGIVDSGIVKPMLKQLGINVEFVRSIVTIGVEQEFIQVKNIESLKEYRDMLCRMYPDSRNDIDTIISHIRKIMDYMDILYGIENPLFKDLKKDKEYVVKTLIPWMFKFVAKAGKIKSFNRSVYEHLSDLTENRQLIDIISQHFFQNTPASFALSYFSLYLDYEYPVGGTGDLINALSESISSSGGNIETKTEIKNIDVINRTVTDQSDRKFEYDQLIWAADQNKLYESVDMRSIENQEDKRRIESKQNLLKGKRGGDSIYSMFLAVDMDKNYFAARSSGHMFYTSRKQGQSLVCAKLNEMSKSQDKNEILQWMDNYLEYTTYEIAIPSLRNKTLAPAGKTGLVVSVLMDYDFIKNIKALGFYDEFKNFTEQKIIRVLDKNIYPGISEEVIHRFSSTPLTIERISGNLDGGITGWAFTNKEMPSVNKMTKISKSCLTPIPNVLQAGQWTYSPSGVPISILTGKIAADKAEKSLARNR